MLFVLCCFFIFCVVNGTLKLSVFVVFIIISHFNRQCTVSHIQRSTLVFKILCSVTIDFKNK